MSLCPCAPGWLSLTDFYSHKHTHTLTEFWGQSCSQLIHTKLWHFSSSMFSCMCVVGVCFFWTCLLQVYVHVFACPTSGRKLLGVDDFGSKLLSRGDLHTPPDHRECTPETIHRQKCVLMYLEGHRNISLGVIQSTTGQPCQRVVRRARLIWKSLA